MRFQNSSVNGSTSWAGPLEGSVCELALLAAPLTTEQVGALYAAYPPPARYVIVTDTWERVVE